MKWPQLISLGFLLLLSGCAVMQKQDNHWVYPPMAVPLQVTLQQEVKIARLSQLLSRPDLSDEVKAKALYERGSYYDNAGLRDLARLDFERSLSINPAQPQVFNLLGAYFTQIARYDTAYDAFDSSLELDPENRYARRNRAIALYYGDRIELAYEEMQAYYRDNPGDPFHALWLYIIEYEIDPQRAEASLRARYEEKNHGWGWALVAHVLGEISEEQLFKAVLHDARGNVVVAQRLTETYFYLAKRYQLAEQYADAVALYKLALSFNVYGYLEHKYSFLELGRTFEEMRENRQEKNEN